MIFFLKFSYHDLTSTKHLIYRPKEKRREEKRRGEKRRGGKRRQEKRREEELLPKIDNSAVPKGERRSLEERRINSSLLLIIKMHS